MWFGLKGLKNIEHNVCINNYDKLSFKLLILLFWFNEEANIIATLNAYLLHKASNQQTNHSK